MIFTYQIFFSWRANLDVENDLYLGVIERFYMQTDIGVIIFVATGYKDLILYFKKYLNNTIIYIFKAISILLLLFWQGKNFDLCNFSNTSVVTDYAKLVMDTIPHNSTIFTHGDLSATTIPYLQLCENYRPDLKIIDMELMTYNWSVPRLKNTIKSLEFPAEQWHLRDTETTFTLNRFLKVNIFEKETTPGVYVCIGAHQEEISYQKSFFLLPIGVCHQFYPKDNDISLVSYIQKYGYLYDSWPYSYDSKFDPKSWEYIANRIIWDAKYNIFF
ncbi:DgyrCDS10916 [Dimorphilus gyrociliatus]|uniref:DgyrCDS10916 n=1 Tax=Dimorphilus gyrociliatus TaxID=2664684 RepID=A0A7I8W2U3_9ANNE|nr:DgyrCDS10916 [Dimorphilus gyrociliatus]